jgi:hypothetical protein
MSPWKWWTAIAGTVLIVGGVAWLLKLWVIVATDGRVVATGAAATFFDLGFYSLVVGSTGLGVRLAINQEPSMRVVLAVAFPAAFFISFGIFSGIGYALVATGRLVVGDALPSYLLEEGGIFRLGGSVARSRGMARVRRGAARSRPRCARHLG